MKQKGVLTNLMLLFYFKGYLSHYHGEILVISDISI